MSNVLKNDPLWEKLVRYNFQYGCPAPRSKKRRIRNKWIKRNMKNAVPIVSPSMSHKTQFALRYIDDPQPTPELLALQRKAMTQCLADIGETIIHVVASRRVRSCD